MAFTVFHIHPDTRKMKKKKNWRRIRKKKKNGQNMKRNEGLEKIEEKQKRNLIFSIKKP